MLCVAFSCGRAQSGENGVFVAIPATRESSGAGVPTRLAVAKSLSY